MSQTYDIFISYRRTDTGEKAEHLKDLLEPRYKKRISFDRENLTGLFDITLIERIDNCLDFLLIVGKKSFLFDKNDYQPEQVDLYNYLATCSQDEFGKKINNLGHNIHLDFVRIEIARALNRKDINIIPIVPQTTGDFDFSKLSLPPDIAGIQRYEAFFYSDSPNALFKDVVPKFAPHLKSKPDSPVRKSFFTALLLFLVLSVSLGSYYGYRHIQEKEKQALMTDTALDGEYLNWSQSVTINQVRIIRGILNNMVKIEGGTFRMGASPNTDGSYDEDIDVDLETPTHEQSVGTFWMGMYEVSIVEWHSIMGNDYDKEKAQLPVTNISFEECLAFANQLSNLTNLNFQIPSEAEWEYAARGGRKPDNTKYAGSNHPDDIAWYANNSGGKPHACDATHSPMSCNALNLYDMSGNVSEWCATDFAPYDPKLPAIDKEAKVIRGGNFDSEPYELTVYHRDSMNRYSRAETVGVRIIIRD